MGTIRELEAERAAAKLAMDVIGMNNVPSDPERRIAQDIEWRRAVNRFAAAERAYRDAINQLAKDPVE